MKIRIFLYLFFVILISCQERKTYENKNSTCELTLFEDGTYKYKTPQFFKSVTEYGKWKNIQNTLILETENYINKDSILNIEYFCANDTPKVLKIRTTNFENNKVRTKFTINNFDKVYSTDINGEFILNYNELENEKIINKGQNIDLFKIIFNHKEYIINLKKDYPNSRKPEELVFKLNDFAGEEYRPLIRRYKIENDTIEINDIQRKLIGLDNVKMYKK